MNTPKPKPLRAHATVVTPPPLRAHASVVESEPIRIPIEGGIKHVESEPFRIPIRTYDRHRRTRTFEDWTVPVAFEITTEDWKEGRRLGLTGPEVVARAMHRANPNIRSVTISADPDERGNYEAVIEYGDPLD